MGSFETEYSKDTVSDLVNLLIRYQASYASIPRVGGGTKRRMPVDELRRIAEQLVMKKTDGLAGMKEGLLKTMLDNDLIEVIVRRSSKAWERALLSKTIKEEKEEELNCSNIDTPKPEISIL